MGCPRKTTTTRSSGMMMLCNGNINRKYATSNDNQPIEFICSSPKMPTIACKCCWSWVWHKRVVLHHQHDYHRHCRRHRCRRHYHSTSGHQNFRSNLLNRFHFGAEKRCVQECVRSSVYRIRFDSIWLAWTFIIIDSTNSAIRLPLHATLGKRTSAMALMTIRYNKNVSQNTSQIACICSLPRSISLLVWLRSKFQMFAFVSINTLLVYFACVRFLCCLLLTISPFKWSARKSFSTPTP